MEKIPCPNCQSTAHYGLYEESTRYSGTLVHAGERAEFSANAVVGKVTEKLIQTRCSGCDRVLVPFEVDGEIHVRALADAVDELRFHSDEMLRAVTDECWERYRKALDEAEAAYIELVGRRVREIAPAAKSITLQHTGTSMTLDGIFDSEKPGVDRMLHSAFEELADDSDFLDLIREYADAARIADDAGGVLVITRKDVADATT